jgi:hypothetical protein
MKGQTVTKSKEDKPEKRHMQPIHPLPPDAPLLSLSDAAAILRMTPGALRKMIEADPTEMGERLRSWIVVLSPRRRYIQRAPLLAWLRGMCDKSNTESVNKLDK